MSRKCKVCDVEALPSDDYCAKHAVESWASAIMGREARASVLLDHGEIGTRSWECPKHPTAEILTDAAGNPVCKMCLQGVV